ncbi:MAG: dephospho-CoA kinase [Victivallaceae bacterium]|jgi:dephospho-CoA kinase|nr:dephospho-CoA kinase [Victivallaceae bacterium]NLK83491.1 dephospho-CoA kinase [Lentisphaerota bacterium]MDD3116488.1 dephospho-CoA kinase [Victivallaceae bacterium]MDD3702985.1 dephospho-CoA kinase [Victivallaceae bacterium]MDD4317252.1 dephospho-CoA kinase [Victivallaceae bacterium]
MIIALTGGIGSGKSAALQAFAELGWKTLSADQICHDIYRDDLDFIDQLYQHWGDTIFSMKGVIDRKAVAKIIFTQPDELKWLNSLLHPMIRQVADKQFTATPEDDYIFEVPLLYECGWEKDFSAVICVWSEASLIRKRLLNRGLNDDEISRRMANQLPADQKLERADFALINNGSLANLYAQCEILTNQIKGKLWK